ncbi:ribbon-helix-helix domain-containing protein [Pseudoxanthomonas sp. 10H]|uniref:ribbon-helix-helix domain-containing protein n=1 Tax=Pseudoxanthomonas sp. 10H TaxID=3242729 RepID=UPI003556232B
MSKQRPIRLPEKLDAQLEAKATERGLTVSAAIREAIRAWLDEEARTEKLDQLEARLVATLNRAGRDSRLARNDTQMAIAMLDSFVRLYLLHTPPLPRDVVKASAAAADERHEKFVRNFIATLQGDTGLIERLAAVFEQPEQVEGEG